MGCGQRHQAIVKQGSYGWLVCTSVTERHRKHVDISAVYLKGEGQHHCRGINSTIFSYCTYRHDTLVCQGLFLKKV